MNKKNLDTLLFSHTDKEIQYLNQTEKFSNRYKLANFTFKDGKEILEFPLPSLDKEKLILRKDSRYTFIPFYTYLNVNLNYIYSGTCTYWIDNKKITLEKGDICIFDKGVIRTKTKLQYQDIIININLSDSFFQESFQKLEGNNIISSFLINHFLLDSSGDNYIIFRTNQNNKIESLFDNLLMEYFDPSSFSKIIMQNYMSIILIELLRLYESNKNIHSVQLSNNKTNTILEMLYFIENNLDTCTILNLSDRFGYHPKYISSYLKKYTGKTFKQIQNEYRIKKSVFLLQNTNMSIEKISESLGFTNRSEFYKKFKDAYRLTPKKFRDSTQLIE